MIRLNLNEDQAGKHFDAVQFKLLHVIGRVLTNLGIKATKKRAAVSLHPDLETYLRKLHDPAVLKQLIVALPNELPVLIRRVQLEVPSLAWADEASLEILYYIFISTNYIREFDKLQFIQRINIDTCVYCNRHYIYYLTKGDRVKPQIDHFYPKAVYPFLGMSFYNLIPSCQTCNGPDCKGEYDPYAGLYRLTNPYEIEQDEFEFSYSLLSARPGSTMAGQAYLIELLSTYPAHLKVFKLDALYRLHGDHIAELVTKASMNYSPAYRSYLAREYKRLGLTDHEIKRLIVGNYLDKTELHRRPLAKLYLDIAMSLGLVTDEDAL